MQRLIPFTAFLFLFAIVASVEFSPAFADDSDTQEVAYEAVCDPDLECSGDV